MGTARLNDLLRDIDGRLSSLLWWYNALRREHQLHRLILTEGPPPPPREKTRVLSMKLLDQFLVEKLGEKYARCPGKHFSDLDYLVTFREEWERLNQFFVEHWLPRIKPYLVIKWRRLDGTEAHIYARDCQQFGSFYYAFPALYEGWTAFCRAELWGRIRLSESRFGGHAYNGLVFCDETFDEKTTKGLRLCYAEPQVGDIWRVPYEGGELELSDVKGMEIRDLTPESFQVEEFWMIKF